MKRFLKENYFLIILWVLCITALYIYQGHYTDIMLDFGREVFYPQRILEGKVLYKDLFAIYGPFAYLLNALLYKFFGTNLSTLYAAGILSSLLFVSGIYLIAEKFMSKFLSFSIGIFTIAAGVSTGILFNFSFPYSWAMLYGIIAFVYSILFLIKYKTDNKNLFLYISSLLCGVCIACKYEFAVFGILLFAYLIYIGIKDFKTGIKAVCAFFAAPLISFGTLFIQGLSLNDLITSLNNVKEMTQTETLKHFYQSVGVYFHPQVLPLLFFTFIKTSVSLGSLIAGVALFNKNKFASVFVTFIGLLLSLWFLTDTKILTFIFLPILLFVTGIICYKKLKNNIPLLIIVISGLAISLKSIWGMLILSYASYYISFVLIAFFALLFNCINKKYQTITAVYMLLLAFFIWFINNAEFYNIKNLISTSKGEICTYSQLAKSTNELISFITKNTNQNDRVVIFPEGLMINFLTDRKSDDYYNSMLPLYTESFGEEKIVEHFENNKPEYFILTNENMKDYGFNNICNDYAFELCTFINTNYDNVKTIDYGYRYLVFKRK